MVLGLPVVVVLPVASPLSFILYVSDRAPLRFLLKLHRPSYLTGILLYEHLIMILHSGFPVHLPDEPLEALPRRLQRGPRLTHISLRGVEKAVWVRLI